MFIISLIGIMTDVLEAFLASNNMSSSSSGRVLGVSCPVLGQAIKEATGVTVKHAGIVPEVSLVSSLL